MNDISNNNIFLEKEAHIYKLNDDPKFQFTSVTTFVGNFFEEFDKVWVHGFLHLLGYNHIKNKDYFKMYKFEKRILRLI